MSKVKKAINCIWARSKAFRIIIITVFFLLMAVPIFLLMVYARILLGVSFWVLLIIVRLIFGYVARKKGYLERAEELSPKYYATHAGWKSWWSEAYSLVS
ncbi:MAG: hypothetical protein QXV01_10180 [Candidatus Bathyarchaeia archaeon]